ncbi:hypothetical protein [Novosphingobium sp.]|uniref:hypothetical protein n=1 Tax=Novosphingobium sp. TaxID=1874826 RepID=UPI0025EE7E61|nr:hypothetical protein [Novosphingobium sp.]
MSGPIGIMSHKIVLKAGLLLISARIDLQPVEAVIDPSAPITTADPSVAKNLKVDPAMRGPQLVIKNRVIGIDRDEMRIHRVDIEPTRPATDLIIGSDLMSDMRIGFDFKRSKLRVFDQGDRHVGKGMQIAAVSQSKISGCLIADARNEHGDPIRMAILGRPVNFDNSGRPLVKVSLGGVSLDAFDIPSGSNPCTDSDVVVTWGNFADQHVIFDVGHNRMWLSPNL